MKQGKMSIHLVGGFTQQLAPHHLDMIFLC
jgi:hypothetical protein